MGEQFVNKDTNYRYTVIVPAFRTRVDHRMYLNTTSVRTFVLNCSGQA